MTKKTKTPEVAAAPVAVRNGRIYIAGPMTGIPQFNFPAFHAAAAALRARGFDIVSPAELDSDAVKEAALASKDGKLDAGDKVAGESWGEILARDVRVIADTIDGIVFLPGWQKSRGAKLEAFVAVLCKKQYFGLYDPEANTVTEVALGWVIREVTNTWGDDIKAHTPLVCA